MTPKTREVQTSDREKVDHAARLAELHRTRLLDSATEEAFDRLTRLASKILHVPVALISLVDEQRQFFVSQAGLSEPWASRRETPLSHSFCQHVVKANEPLIVADARTHPLVQDNLAVEELGVVAYAGIPLTTSSGQALGAFCAIDSQPRNWTAEEIEILRDLTGAALTEIELKRIAYEASQQAETAERERREKVALLEATADGIYGLDLDGRCTFINRAAAEVLARSPDEVLGKNFHELAHSRRPDGSPYPAEECPILRACRSGQSVRGDNEVFWRSDGSCFPIRYLASPIMEDGQLKGSVVTVSDITERKRTVRRLAMQHAVSEVLAKATSFHEAAPLLLRSLGEALEWQLGAVWAVDEGAEVLRCVTTWKKPGFQSGDYDRATRERTFARGAGLPGRVWASGEPIWTADILEDKRFARAAIIAEVGLRGAVFFPILIGSDVLGVVEFFSPWLPEADSDILRTVKAAGYQIGQFVRRQRAQEKLRNSEALKTAVIHTAMDCVIVMDHEGKILEWNPSAEKTFGYRRDDVLGQEMAELIVPPSLREKHRSGLRHYLSTGEGPVVGKRIEITGMRADGSEFPVELAITPVLLDSTPAFTGYVRDITQRKREEARQQEQMRLASLTADIGTALTQRDQLTEMLQSCAEELVRHLDGAFARIWTLDSEDNILCLQASAGLYTHLDGKHSRIPVGQFKIGLIAQEKKPHLTNAVIGDPRVGDQEWAKKQGMVSFAGYPLIVGDQVLGVMGMFAKQPLSEATLQAMSAVGNGIALGIQRSRTQEEVKRAKEAAEEANNAKSQFLANMSHELRTPLNAVILYSELLMEEAGDLGMEVLLPDLEKIRHAGKHLLELITSVLDLSKIESGKMELFVEEFNISSMVQDAAATVRPLVEKRMNSLEIICPNDLGYMRSDLTKVRQVLFNLLSNASKFTEKGIIRLVVRREVVEQTDWIIIETHDSGIGMTEEQQTKLFQAFTQADASTTRKYGGTGLGLAITKRLCEMLGGDISVQSRLGVGSIFTVRIPVTVSTAPERKPETQQLGITNVEAVGTVLVIDDDAAARDTMTRLLRKEGYETVTASDGEAGLRLARQVRPDVITLDVMMPRTDGWAVLAEIKADPELASIPVIMLTMVDDRNLGYLLGATEYLTKPVDRVRLYDVLKKYRPRRTHYRVVVAEDDEGTRRMLRDALNEQGWDVEEAENGQAALELVVNNPPDLILLDLLMPQMDGFQFVAELENCKTLRRIPVIVITAKDLSPEERQRLNGNVQNVLQKGMYSREAFLREIRELVSRCAGSVSNPQDRADPMTIRKLPSEHNKTLENLDAHQ